MSAIFTPLKLALLCYLLGLSAQIIASVIALSQIKKVDSYRSGWVLLSLGLTLMLIMRIDYVYPLFSNVDYSLFKPFLALIISLLLMLGVIKIRSLFDVMHNQEIALYKLAKCDTLTDCLSRYAIFEQGLMMIKLSIRLKRPLAILMIDIDKFKNINDEYGHSYGDQVLIQFVSVCKNALRSIDIVGRFGGDEFIAILPEANLEVALSVIQRIKADISNANFMFNDEKLQITASIGISIYDPACVTNDGPKTAEALLDQLVNKADLSMYVVKKARKDYIESTKN